MRHEPNLRIENYRVQPAGYESGPGENWGAFQIGALRVVSSGCCEGNSEARDWEHVSVSLPNRCPTWEEMDRVKNLFWRDDETVIQFHPRKDVKINCHRYCLHLWKMNGTEFVLPPSILVG